MNRAWVISAKVSLLFEGYKFLSVLHQRPEYGAFVISEKTALQHKIAAIVA